MYVIGHRGARGLALENTLDSIKKANDLGVDGIEFDVRLTKDRQFVLCHDPDLLYVAGDKRLVEDLTLAEIKKIKLKDGQAIPTLSEVLQSVGSAWAIIEVKSSDCAKELLEVLDNFPDTNVSIASFDHQLAAELESVRPELSVFLAEHFKPLEIIQLVRTAKADGLDLNAWLLNPLTYWLAKRHNLKLMVYTVNHRFIAWFINKLYPDVYVVTDFPDRFIK